MELEIQQQDLNAMLWHACDIFNYHGVEDPLIHRDYILTLLFWKYISDFTDFNFWEPLLKKVDHGSTIKSTIADLYITPILIPHETKFSKILDLAQEPGNGARIDRALEKISRNFSLHDVFRHVHFDSPKLGDRIERDNLLEKLLRHFASDTFNFYKEETLTSDLVSNAFEYFLQKSANTVDKKMAGFFSPPEVSGLLVNIAAPQIDEEIFDPACGTGSLLIRCSKYIKNRYSPTPPFCKLHGQEIDNTTWALARMQMLLHDQINTNILWGDTLRNPKFLTEEESLKTFDVVLSIPPFVLNNWGDEKTYFDFHKRFEYGLPPKNRGTYAFIQHIIKTLKKDTGRAVIVSAQGVLFRRGGEGLIRRNLIKDNLIESVISLPAKLFFDNLISTVILVFNKQKKDTNILFIDASRDFHKDKIRNILRPQDISKIITTLKNRSNVPQYAYLATMEEIEKFDWELKVQNFLEYKAKQTKPTFEYNVQYHKDLKNEFMYLNERINSCIADITKLLSEV